MLDSLCQEFIKCHSIFQIEKLPSKSFWESLTKLHTLYLHDNGISRFEDVKNLAQACRLTILTLYDTPLSLKNNYRHCVVNAIWSLRCLDSCVVSDEEIIEDANFLPQYKPMQPHFCFKSCYLKKNKVSFLYEWGNCFRYICDNRGELCVKHIFLFLQFTVFLFLSLSLFLPVVSKKMHYMCIDSAKLSL